jgi:TolB-like protein
MSLAVAVVLALALGAHKPKVAVLDVQDITTGQAEHARLLTQIITGELSRDGSLDVVSSSQIRDMLGFEKQKQLLGCNEGSCLAEIGGALGVDYLLVGQLGKIGSRFRLDLSLIDQKKARTAATRGDFLPANEDALADATVAMVNDVLAKAGLRDSASAALAVHQSSAVGVSHTGAYVTFGVAAALLAGAGVMQVMTNGAYHDMVDHKVDHPELKWMSPLTDALWVGSAVAAGLGTYLYFSASASGSGGEVAVGGHF